MPQVEIDPDIALITPHLMATAPTIFSSNLPDEVLKGFYLYCSQYRILSIELIVNHIKLQKENSRCWMITAP